MKKNYKILLIILGIIVTCVVVYQLLFSPSKDYIVYEIKIISISGENTVDGDTLLIKNINDSSAKLLIGDSISIKVKPLMVSFAEISVKTSSESEISGPVIYPYIIKGIIIKVYHADKLKYRGPYG